MRKACRRQRFALGLNPVRLAFLGGPVPAAEWQTIRVRELLGINALTAGTAQRHDLAQLLAGVQTAVGLACMGYGTEALPELQAARAVLQAIIGTQEPGAMRAGAAELAALREALAVVDAQREVVPRRDHERAAAQAMRMIERRPAG